VALSASKHADVDVEEECRWPDNEEHDREQQTDGEQAQSFIEEAVHGA
jgi:hypothetical protein